MSSDTPIYDQVADGAQPEQLSQSQLDALDASFVEPHPADFNPDLVPEGPASDYFYDGRTGRGLTNAEWDEQCERAKLDPVLDALLHGKA